MKFKYLAIMAGIFILYGSNACASNKFSSGLFSIEIPADMVADEKNENSILLVFTGDNELEKGTLSVSARKAKIVTLEEQWQKVRPTITNGKSILFEKEVPTHAQTWKTIGVKGKAGPLEMQNVAYYSVYKDVIYMLNYHCQPGHCKEIDIAFRKVFKSFKSK